MTPIAEITDTPAWALAEKAAHAAEAALRQRQLAIDDAWLRMFTAYVANAHHTGAHARWYDRILDAGMTQKDAEREALRA